MLHDEMGAHLEKLCNIPNQHFPNDQYMLQNYAWAKVHSEYKQDQWSLI